MDSANPRHLQFSHRFDDFDAFAEVTRGWDLDFWQLDSGPFRADLTQVLTSSTLLVECAFSRKIEQRGAPPRGCRTFGFAANGNFDLKWRGKSVGPQQLMLFPPGGALESISQPGFHVFAFSVSEGVLEEAAARKGFDSVTKLFPATDLITCPGKIMAKIRDRAKTLSLSAANNPELVNIRPFRESLELDLVDSVLDAISTCSGPADSYLSVQSRTKAMKMAIDVIEDRADEPVSVAEIARLTGVTDRTLRYAFEESYGVSPKQYLQAFRLNQVHRHLRRALKEGQNISDVANTWGFWHMGQFARDYRQMFGVLPGDTLNSG